MRVVGLMSASSRRAIVLLGLVAVFAATSSVRAQQAPAAGAPAPAPAQAPAPPPDGMKFSSDAALVIWSVKADQTANFEKVMAALKTRLSASDNPEVKALAEGMKLFKAAVPPQAGQPVSYLHRIDPASKTLSYNPTFLLFEAKKADGMTTIFERAEAKELYDLLIAAIDNLNPLPLNVVAAP